MTCARNTAVRAVVLTGAGRNFCFGGDLRAMASRDTGGDDYMRELTTYLHAAISHFVRMDAPVIAAVNGTAAGAGVGLAAMADLALCGTSSKFNLAYTKAGLTPDAGTSFLLPRTIGVKRAMELLLHNRTLSAEEALDWGLVNEVVADDGSCVARALELAEQLARGRAAPSAPPSACWRTPSGRSNRRWCSRARPSPHMRPARKAPRASARFWKSAKPTSRALVAAEARKRHALVLHCTDCGTGSRRRAHVREGAWRHALARRGLGRAADREAALVGYAPFRDYPVDFFLALPDEAACSGARARLEPDFQVDVKELKDDREYRYSLHATKNMRLIVPEMQDVRRRLTAIATELKGRYDGWAA